MSPDLAANRKEAATIVGIIGVDGSGKSTVAQHLSRTYRARGYTVDILWLRYNHFLTKPLLGFCRLVGLTEYRQVGVHRIGYHHFYRSRIVSTLFAWLQYLDALRVRWFRIRPLLKKPRHVVILDRYVYDVLVDVVVDTRNEQLPRQCAGRRLVGLMPVNAVRLMIRRSWLDVLDARPESALDAAFRRRYDAYESVATMQDVVVLENVSSLSDLLESAERAVGLR